MSKADRRINRTIHLAKHVVRIKRADGGETDPLLQPDVVAPARPEREWGPAITPEQAFSAPKQEGKPSLVDRAFSTMTGGRNLENDISQFRSRLPDVQQYGSAVQHAVNEARQMQNLGVQNMKSGEVGRSVLGAAQVPLGYFNQAIAPVTGAFELASEAAGRFDPRLKAEADVIGLLGAEGSSALSKTARAASDISNYLPAATLAAGAIPAKAADARPLVMHGTPERGLTSLEPRKANEVRGTTWFTDTPEIAEQYTYPREYGEIVYDAPAGEVHQARLNIQNPYIVDAKGKTIDAIEQSRLVREAQNAGHDSLILKNVDDSVDSSGILGTSYAVWDKNQIELVKPEAEKPSRALTDLGFYSHGAETAAGLPQAKGTADQMISMLRNQGVRPEELAHAGLIDEAAIAQRQAEIKAAYEPKIQAAEQGLAGLAEGTPEYKAAKRLYDNTVSSMRAEMDKALVVHPDWAGRTVTRDELHKHLTDSMPQVEETRLGGSKPPEMDQTAKQRWIEENAAESAYNSGDIENVRDWRDASPEVLDWHREIAQNKFDELMSVNSDFAELFQSHGEGVKTKFQEYTLPGGENYREVLLKLPFKPIPTMSPDEIIAKWEEMAQKKYQQSYASLPNHLRDEISRESGLNRQTNWPDNSFKSSHWDDPNVLAHVRMSDRTGPNGEKLLHVEELQSDWGQEGKKKGFKGQNPLTDAERDEFNRLNVMPDHIRTAEENAKLDDFYKRLHANQSGTPMAPYVTSTQGWTDLALKRVMKEAAEGGYDGIVFTPGAEQAKRYDLSKQVGKVYYDPDLLGGTLAAEGLNGQTILDKRGIKPENVAEYIGKEAAEKLLKQERDLNGHHVLEGNGLKIGGEGMKGYYDQIVPKRLQELVKQHDKEAKLSQKNINFENEGSLRKSLRENGYDPNSVDIQEILSDHGGRLPRWLTESDADSIAAGDHLNFGSIQTIPMLHMPMTDKMRQSILSGQKAFNEGGRVGFADGGAPWNNDLSVNPFEYNPAQGSNVPLANLNLYQGYTPPAPQAPEALPEKKPDVTPVDTAYYPDGSGGNSADSGASAIGPSPSAAPAPSQSPAPAPDATPEATTGLGGWISGKVQSAVNNPLATMTNLGVGFVPGFGLLNTVSGLLGGPTVGTAISPNKAAPAAPEKATVGKISASDDVDVAQTAGNLGGFGTAGFNNGISDATGLSGGMGGGSEGMGGGPGGGGGGSEGPGGGSGGAGAGGQGGSGAGAGAGAGAAGGSTDGGRDGNDNSGAGAGAGSAGSGAGAGAGAAGGSTDGGRDGNDNSGGGAGAGSAGTGDNSGAGDNSGGGNSEGAGAGVKHGGAITLRRYRAEGGPIKITPAQASAGNYKKKHVNFQGLPVAIETQKGHIREKVVNGEVHWRVKMPSDYGYVKGTKDNDGDATDVFLGPNHKSGKVWLIDQADTKTGKFDEHKAMLGFDSKKQAMDTYIRSFSDGKGKKRVMNTTEMSVDQYKNWVKNGNLRKPVASSPLIHKALGVVSKKK